LIPKHFSRKSADGRTVASHSKNQIVFSQGDKADASFTFTFGQKGRPEAAIPKMSQETLAEIIGTTRSRVSYFMNKFRKLAIKYNGGVEVHSSLLNIVLHD
jgi:hypothetical protein